MSNIFDAVCRHVLKIKQTITQDVAKESKVLLEA